MFNICRTLDELQNLGFFLDLGPLLIPTSHVICTVFFLFEDFERKYSLLEEMGFKKAKHGNRLDMDLCFLMRLSVRLVITFASVSSPSSLILFSCVANLESASSWSWITIADGDLTLAKLFTKEVLYSWGDKDIARKVIFLSSCLLENVESVRKILTDAADKCVTVEFTLLEHDTSPNVQEFVNSISDLENCSLRTYLADKLILHGIVKQWLQDLKDNLEEPLQATFRFKNNLTGSMDQIFCNLFASVNQIKDGFSPCQTCRCHGMPLDGSVGNKSKSSSSCPTTCQELRTSDLVENALKVGEHTILLLPSFQSFPEFQQVSAPIIFNVIERTNLGSLSEGAIIGSSFIVAPSTSPEDETTSDESDKSDMNTRFFHALCQALHSLDQGLVCSSNCNMETMKMASFHCFYLLQPSDKGPMLLRRLAGAEEILPFPESIKLFDSDAPKEMVNSVQSSLLKMELRDYNPLFHESGFHKKLNSLVKESLHFGPIPQKRKESKSEVSLLKPDPSEMTIVPASTKTTKEEQIPQMTQAIEIDDSDDCLTEEWEQLIVSEDCMIYSPTCVSVPKNKTSVLSPLDGNKQLGEKTSRILERLEAPRQLKTKGSSPIIVNSSGTVACTPKKKPLVPFVSNNATDQHTTLSQPLKPDFQRLKRRPR
ncbi:hypothetical protein FRX31_004468 [Thalictrum thalictroides]|uniref:Uncharacterized protein n=1 Tax=Thalictrum thalictroides TaxID=46969 RepID=A0A7J6X833_THATH|nr:hypothetical protein FRX31_004468 [Thalictrum thalictroides]